MDAPSAACGAIDAAIPAAAAPVLVIGIGNPSRGDDALGPACLDAIRDALPAGVELLTDFQLQIEHALDLAGRALVVFVDASVDCQAPFEMGPIAEAASPSQFSHALSPAQLLDAYRRVRACAPPPAQVLAIRGYRFELGEPICQAARANLDQAARCLIATLA